MRKLISLMHVSLDGFCAGPKGEMDWIALNDAIFADVETLVERSGAAVYGRTTYGLMRGYWPGVLLAWGLYEIARSATALPLDMTWQRVLGVFLATLVMCLISGAVAVRRLRAAQPADVF